jgi:hypothetical protein
MTGKSSLILYSSDLIKDYKLLPGLKGKKVIIIPSFYYDGANRTDNWDKSVIGLGYLVKDSIFNVIGSLIEPKKGADIIVNRGDANRNLEYSVRNPEWKFAVGGGNMSVEEIEKRFGQSELYVPHDEQTKAAIKHLYNTHSAKYFSNAFSVPDSTLIDLVPRS